MPRPIRAQVDLAALRHNLHAARQRAAGRKIWAVVKANAYGHGIERAVRGFAAADGLALLDFDEANRARTAGWQRPILMLEGCFDLGDVESCRELGLTTVVRDESQLRMLELAPAGGPVGVHLKVNTGMNRLGFDPAEVPSAVARLVQCAAARIEGVSMHFANADRADPAAGPVSMDEQLARFNDACRDLAFPRSLSNSAALFLHPPLNESWVRPGIALYGATPDISHSARELGLRPAMRLVSELLAVQTIPAGAAVGYGSRFVATQPTRVGVVACGYADGYPRHAPDGTPVAVAGRVVPMVGRVSMDMITVDLTSTPDAVAGTPVELWGDIVPIDAVADRCDTVGYELMCAVARRVRFEEVG